MRRCDNSRRTPHGARRRYAATAAGLLPRPGGDQPVHRFLPFFARRWLYRLCGFEIDPQRDDPGRRALLPRRPAEGRRAARSINRGIYLDNRAGLSSARTSRSPTTRASTRWATTSTTAGSPPRASRWHRGLRGAVRRRDGHAGRDLGTRRGGDGRRRGHQGACRRCASSAATRRPTSARAKASRRTRSAAATGSRIERRGARPTVKVALVDGGSFVLPYDHQLVADARREGIEVEFTARARATTASSSRRCARLPGVDGARPGASRGTVAPRWRGALAYLALWLELVAPAPRLRSRQPAVQRLLAARAAVPLAAAQAPRVHGAQPVPHGFAGRRHRPTEWIARLARTLVFVSRFSRDDFIARYGEELSRQVAAAGHGLMPVVPGLRAGALPAGAAARGARLLEHRQAVQGRRAVRRAGALAAPARAGLGLEIHGAWAPELAGLKAELAASACGRGRATSTPPSLLRAPGGRNVVFLLPYREATAVGRAVLAAAPRPPLPLHRRRRPRRLPAPLRPGGAAAAGAQRRCRRRRARAPRSATADDRRRLQAAQDASGWRGADAAIAAVYASDLRGRCHNRAAFSPAPARPAARAAGPSPMSMKQILKSALARAGLELACTADRRSAALADLAPADRALVGPGRAVHDDQPRPARQPARRHRPRRRATRSPATSSSAASGAAAA